MADKEIVEDLESCNIIGGASEDGRYFELRPALESIAELLKKGWYLSGCSGQVSVFMHRKAKKKLRARGRKIASGFTSRTLG